MRGKVIFLLTLVNAVSPGVIDIEFLPGFSFSFNPRHCENIFYAPLNQPLNKPIEAYITEDGVRVETGDLASAEWSVESFDLYVVLDHPAQYDFWNETGQLCQWAYNVPYPRRRDRRFAEVTCGSEASGTKLRNLIASKGHIIAEGLYHFATDAPNNPRILRFQVYSPGNNTVVAEKDTPTTLVFGPAITLNITGQPPPTFEANSPVNITARIRGLDTDYVQFGPDSCGYITLQISYEFKTFYHSKWKEMFLHHTSVRMDSSEAITHANTYDRIIYKRAINGRVSFDDIRVLDVMDNVRFNLTLTMARDPWTRLKNNYTDVASMYIKTVDGEQVISFNTSYTTNEAVVLSNYFNVTAQTANSLVLITPVSDIKTLIGANFPIKPDLVVEIQDSHSRRIYSGPDSNLVVTTTTTPSSACLSGDSSFTLRDGRGTFTGSICEPIESVSLTFSVNKVGVTPVTTPSFNVTGEIHIATYMDTYTSGSSYDVQPHCESFAKFAVMDINKGVYPGILGDRTLHLQTFDTKDDVLETIIKYRNMIHHGKANPNEMVRGIVGFGHNKLTEKLTPSLNVDMMPVISTRETKIEFGDKTLYPYYNRLAWHEGSITQSVFLAAKSRRFTHILIIRSEGYELNNIIYEKASANDITIVGEVVFPVLAEDNWVRGDLQEYMAKIKSFGTRIIFCYISHPLLYHVLREAYHAGLSCLHGYQWVMVGSFVWSFPFFNQHAECQMSPICTVAYRGLQGYSQTYDVAAFNTPDWLRVMGYHMYSDRSVYKGIAKYVMNEVGAEFGLVYDAVRMYATAISTLIAQQETITGAKIALAIRDVEIDGLSGRISLDAKGDRPGYQGFMVNVNPIPPELGVMPTNVAIYVRMMFMEKSTSTTQLEVVMEAYYPLYLPPYNHILGQVAFPNTPFVNIRYFNSSSGMLDRETQRIVPIPPDTSPPEFIQRRETSVAPFYCSKGCGGHLLRETDITKYELGNCIAMETCKCIEGYTGSNCSNHICSCTNGRCDATEVCTCETGWLGTKCIGAVCETPCVDGMCSAVNSCDCDSGLQGVSCGMFMPLVIILFVILGGGAIVCLFFFIRCLNRRAEKSLTLKNLDWVVEWDEVTACDEAVGVNYTASSHNEKTDGNVVEWKHQKCYAQKFNVATLDINDEIRLEMMLMKKVRHKNLLIFIGACLKAPQVALLTEFTPKGSLKDLLSNESVKLGWDFRFSILRDICKGMGFLHRSEIGSHGRLKSTNCLVDSRWTCKVAGFGLPTMRYKAPRISEDEEGKKPSALFWTAPEFLKTCHSVAEVGSGSKAGDVYSFSIIVTEVCTRKQPFSFELKALTSDQVIQMVIDENALENEEARQLWNNLGIETSNPFRPHVEDSCLPADDEAELNIRKMLDKAWNANPDVRPVFDNLLHQLCKIHPVKGKLRDNLINLLEKYSRNLEGVAAERTKDLQVEESKSEQLMSQMLPKKVMEDLKHGRKVEPESFECVTIFFSDIVGFTDIVGNSTPLQIVDLLNDLYTTYDTILDQYDVYKVKTNGDSYMVVSGLPIRNGNQHAAEIATMSLDLMASMTGFKIRHMPGEMLQLRVGIHSGPCIASVVGLKMTSYCLFGETVDTASRMDSSSKALRIHMSEATANILKTLGGYNLERRGEREVKGKGVMTTYWLLGKDTFTKPQPNFNQ